MVAHRDRLAQSRVLEAVHHRAVAPGVGGVLVVGQVPLAEGDALLGEFGHLDHVLRDRALGSLGLHDRPAADLEGAQVALDGGAVDLHGLEDRLLRERHQPHLPGRAEDHHVGEDRVPEQRLGQGLRVEEGHAVLEPRLQRQPQPVGGQAELPVAGEVAGDDLVRVDHRAGLAGAHEAQRLGARGRHHVAADHGVRLAGGHSDRGDVLGALRDAAVDVDRAALLGQTRHLYHAGAAALQMRGHGQDRTHRHDARAADAGDDDVVRAIDGRQRRFRQVTDLDGRGGLLADPRALHGHEGGAEPFEAGEVLVARGLVDGALAPEFGVDRHQRHAVRLHAAVAAALADVRVDEHAAVGVGKGALLAPPALLGRAGLDVDDGRDAGRVAQLALDLLHPVAGRHRHALGKPRGVHLLLLVAHHADRRHAHGAQLVHDAVGVQAPLVGLAARHRHGVVVEDLEGDVRPGRERGTDRERARVVVGAVAEVLEDVGALGERRLPDPVGALAAHLREGHVVPVHPHGHVVAAHPGIAERALGHLRGGVVRAARAEVGLALGEIGGVVRALDLLEPRHCGLDPVGAPPLLDEDPAELERDRHRVERVAGGEQLLAARALLPAVDAPAAAVVEDRLLDLHLDELALLLHDHDQVEPLGPVVEALHVERPGHADLVGGDPEPLGLRPVDAQKLQRVGEVEPVLAGGHEADPRAGPAPHAPVEAVGAPKGLGREALVVDDPRLLRHRVVAEADVEAAGRQRDVGRPEGQPVRVAVDDGGGLHRVLHRLEPDPQPRVARQRVAEEAEIEDLLHARGREHRHVAVHHGPIGLVQRGRGLAGVVVAHRHEDAAMGRGAGHVGVAHRVARAVHAGALAVPQAEHAVVEALAPELGLLRAPKRRRGQVLVEAGLEADPARLQQLARPAHLEVHRAQRRAAIARDVARGVEPRHGVARALHEHQAHQCLGAVQEHRRLLEVESVAQPHILHRHDALLP